MKNPVRLFTALFMVAFLAQTQAQESHYVRTPGYWTLGLNGGLAYQTSDICATLDGWGAGATLAKNLYYKSGAPLTFDLRGRALYDQSYGQDHFRSYGIDNNPALESYQLTNGGPGFVFQNHKTHHGELALEGVIGFNRLREKTNVNLSLFGGIGLDYYATLTDQKDATNSIYQYGESGIDPNARRQTTLSQLENLQDGRYESKAEGFGQAGQLAFMPALGMELGYQLTPRFSVGVGHKLTFTKTDLFDGQQWNDDNRLTSDNDLHHYTNLHLRWIIDPKKDKLQPPEIELITPNTNPYTTQQSLALVKARIKNINSPMDVDYTVNGQRVGFDFRKGQLTNDFRLHHGRNEVTITATNTAGSDREKVIIYYEKPYVDDRPTTDLRKPRVDFTNPSRSTEYTLEDQYSVNATILHVDNRRDIAFEVNGRKITDFRFDARNDRFTADIRLEPGNNELRLAACNPAGEDRDEATLVLERQQVNDRLPEVTIFQPNTDPFYTDADNARIRADIFHVEDKLDVRFEVNGRYVRNFSFSGSRFSGTANLRHGRNTIVVKGKNDAGEDWDEVVIFYKEAETILPPEVDITDVSQPTADPFNPDQCKVSVDAEIRNVESKSDIVYLLDGNRFYDFNYNPATHRLTSIILIDKGDHRVVIKAQNEAGTDQDEADVNSCTGYTAGKAPEVDITSPKDGSITNRTEATVKALLKRVDRKSDITFTVNGRRQQFNYKPDQGVFGATIKLKEGRNEIEVTGKNRYGDDTDRIAIRYNKVVEVPKRPPVVTINSPRNNNTVTKNTVGLDALVEEVFNKRDITVLLNNRKVSSFDFASRSGRLTARLGGLKKGKNTITVKATNDDGRDEASVRVVYEVPVALPTVRIIAPRDGAKVSDLSANIKATLTHVDSKKDVTLTVNGRTVSRFSYSRGQLTATVTLKEGRNTVEVEGRNKAGRASDEVSVIYEKRIPSPAVTITTPRDGAKVSDPSANIKATLTHVDSKRDITLTVNGRAVSRFSYSRGQLTATVNLKEGRNAIEVEGRNQAGRASDEVSVIYEKRIPSPAVTITTPRDGVKVSDPSANIKATLTHVGSKKDITLTVNGRAVSRFSYSRGQLTATVNLKEGRNAIEVEGRNQAGRASDEVSVIYEKRISPPTIKITTPRNGAQMKKPTASLKATLTNVSSQRDITLLVNGREQSKFSYKRGQLSASVQLKEGKNTLEVRASNAAGMDKDAVTVVYKKMTNPVAKPKITLFDVSQPTADPMNPNFARSSVDATFANIGNRNQVKLYVNNKPISDFSFNPKARKLSAIVQLQRGTNHIRVVATNDGGSAEKTKEIDF